MTTYTFVLSDRNGQTLGDLHQASERSLTFTLSGTPTASFTLPLSDPLARQLSDPDTEHLVKVYAHTPASANLLVFHGPVVDAETTFGMNGSVRVNCAGPFWNLTHRYLGGKGDEAAQPTYTDMARSLIAHDLIDKANAQGNTGIQVNPLVASGGVGITTITDMEFKNVAEWIMELGRGQTGASTSDGFDWGIIPIEYNAGAIGRFESGEKGSLRGGGNIATNLVGQYITDAVVFEMGTGTKNNLTAARQPVTRDGLANVIYHVKPEDAAGAVMKRDNSASISARGRHEAVLRDDILDDTYRGQLLDSHIAVRKQPRRVLEITPAPEDEVGRVPLFWDDYQVGDQVNLRIVEWGDVIVNAVVRIYGVAVTIDDAGTPTHTLTIIPTS